MGMMDGKRGLIVGIANDRSFAYSIAESLIREGAECLFTHLPGEKMERRVRKACQSLGVDDPWLKPLNAASDEELDSVFEAVKQDHGTIDFLVHSIAFADKDWLRDGVFTTPDVTSGILESVTRRTILDIAGSLDIPVAERALGRTELYLADEAFYCGTGQEIMPIVAFDGRPVGEGVPGLVTRRLQAAFDDIVRGRNDAYRNWLTPVYHG